MRLVGQFLSLSLLICKMGFTYLPVLLLKMKYLCFVKYSCCIHVTDGLAPYPPTSPSHPLTFYIRMASGTTL